MPVTCDFCRKKPKIDYKNKINHFTTNKSGQIVCESCLKKIVIFMENFAESTKSETVKVDQENANEGQVQG